MMYKRSNLCVSWVFYEEYVCKHPNTKAVWNSEMDMEGSTKQSLLHYMAGSMHVLLPAGREADFLSNATTSIVMT